MADEVWYYLENRQQRGPVSFEELQGLVQAGTVQPSDMVWSPDMSGWAPASTVPDLVPPGAAAAPPPPPAVGGSGPSFAERSRSLFEGAAQRADAFPHLRVLDGFLDRGRNALSEDRLSSVDRLARTIGHWLYLGAALVLVILWIVLGIKLEEVGFVLVGLVVIPVVAVVAHYLAVRFLGAGEELIRKAPSRLTSEAFLRGFGLLALLGAFVSFLTAFYVLFDGSSWIGFALALAWSLVLCYAGGAALTPSSLGIETGGDAGAGDEAVGVMMFLLKLPLRLIQVLYGVGALAGFITALWLLVQSFESGSAFFARLATDFTQNILAVALIPFAIYLVFLLYYLLLAVLRAILAVPAKLDALHGRESDEEKA